ncbi:MAG TPA: ATP-binding cassette domain-containing protein [Bacteroidales bacterium]|nr:ATP-binding cassette domain-containing protein [Bacteroidales bacterium]HPS17729.1 ATP-binding cassette domain-containing protein [Bacteroidales bacterium]
MDIFQAVNVSKRFANHTALDKVGISVPLQSIFGLLGPNGAGKTTLIRIINQITGPDEGEIFFNGEKLNSKHVEQIGYLPEERGLYKKMKVGEQALYLAQLKGLSKRDALTKLKYWFEKFEIQAWWNRKVEELSKGMQQKVQFIVTILHEPKLLIFDEPFSGFDPINVNLLRDEILTLRKNGATIIFSTHNMASVEELCDDIALINKSKKILDGSVKDIRKQFKTDIYEFELENFSGNLETIMNGKFKLIEEKPEGEITRIKIKTNKGISQNELIHSILPFAQILSFHEIIPSMNDIFISQVEGDFKTD